MKLTSLQFTLAIAALFGIAGGAYQLGQRDSKPRSIVFDWEAYSAVPAHAPEAILLYGYMELRGDDLRLFTTLPGVPGYAPRPGIAAMDSKKVKELEEHGARFCSALPASVSCLPPVTRVRVLRTEGDLSKVQILTRGLSPNRAVYVVTSELRTTEGSRTFSPFEQEAP